jgi:hypothetical protein
VNGKSTSILTIIKRFQPCSNNNISVGKLKVERRSCITLTVIYTTELLFPLSEKIRVVSLQDFVLTSMKK